MSFLELLSNKLPDCKIAICKELTKMNEKVVVGTSKEVFDKFRKNSKNLLGEFVLVVEQYNTDQKNHLLKWKMK